MTRCLPGISSMSLGRCDAGHKLLPKITKAAEVGFKGIELFEEDLIGFTKEQYSSSSHKLQLIAANDLYKHCKSLGLEIVCLQPFRFYEGLTDPVAHAAKLQDWRHWLQLARALHTDLLSIASTFGLPQDQVTGDLNVLAADMAELADMAAAEAGSPPLRVSYEALAWGSHVDTWERSWEVVRLADRPNFGICLDTFNIAARVFADPAAASGQTPNAVADMRDSIARIIERVDVAKVFNMQLVDGERLSSPLVKGHEYYNAEQPTRMSWSRNCRLFYGETSRGAYMPVLDIARAILDGLGYRGWVTMELFSRTCAQPGDDVVAEHAERGIQSWHRLCEDLGPHMLGLENGTEKTLG